MVAALSYGFMVVAVIESPVLRGYIIIAAVASADGFSGGDDRIRCVKCVTYVEAVFLVIIKDAITS